MPSISPVPTEVRRQDREEVHIRTSAIGPAETPFAMLIVNISPSGLMARCDALLRPDDTITFRLQHLPPLTAIVRWALGGRIGCEFARPIDPASFYPVLQRLSR